MKKWLILIFLKVLYSSALSQEVAPLQYSGSSTIGRCLQEASLNYDSAKVSFNTLTESQGGIKDLLEGKADIAGFAGTPSKQIDTIGLLKQKIGRDAIGVIVNDKNPIQNLSSIQLKRIFAGEITNWQEIGGANKPIDVYIMDHSSATHFVFRRQILKDSNYVYKSAFSPDSNIIHQIAINPYAIGHVSLSFLKPFDGVKAINIDQEIPSVFNDKYPIGRNLYLLYWKNATKASQYANWVVNQKQKLMECGFQVHYTNSLKNLKYVGSSTLGKLIYKAQNVYPLFNYSINTIPESEGGENSILLGNCDIAGVARTPSAAVFKEGIRSTFVGSDAIAVVVNNKEITNLTSAEIQKIYQGEISNWSEIGKSPGAIKCYRVSPKSATYHLFKDKMLLGNSFSTSVIELEDSKVLEKIEAEPGSIGFITRSFLNRNSDLVVKVDGMNPWENELAYALQRPLFLLWNDKNKSATQFVNWVLSPEGQEIITDLYTGAKVQYEISKEGKTGMLKVYTDVKPTIDAQVIYYPHSAYTIKTISGETIRYVSNSRGRNDELPETVYLAEGKYYIVPETQKNETFLVEIVAGKTTSIRTRASSNEKIEKERENLKSKYFQLYGDMRLRTNYDNTNGKERFRARYRFRIGTNIQLTKDLRIGARLVSTQDKSNYKSTHVDFSGFDQLGIALDRLFIYYHPQKTNWFHLWVGKNALPYQSNEIYTENVWDEDIQPEGVTMAIRKNFNNSSEFSVTGGYYIFNAFSSSQTPPSFHSNEIYFKGKLGKRHSLAFENTFYGYLAVKGLNTNNDFMLANGGNSTVSDSVGNYYKNGFNINSSTIKLKLFEGKWPLLLKGEFIYNLSATTSNTGYVAGISFGQLGRRNGLQFYFQYQMMQQDALFTPFTQDDFLEQTQFSGTISGVSWSLNKKMRLHAWFLTSVQEITKLNRNRLRLDLDIKF